jgi:DNA-directed RNA polymerase subunit H (RpoH/RPB5)
MDNFKSPQAKALETLKEMLLSRGYKADNFDTIGSPLDDTTMYTFSDVFIVFSHKARLTQTEIGNFLEYAEQNNHKSTMIIVTLSRPSEAVILYLRDYIAVRENILVQIFELSHLQFNISKHRKVPRHTRLDDEAIVNLKKLYSWWDSSKFRRIDCQDPMAKWVGARPGDVVQVEGLCPVSGSNKHWDLCVANPYDV